MQDVHTCKIWKVHYVKIIDLVVTKYARFTHGENTQGTLCKKKYLVETKYARFTHVDNAEGTLCKKNILGSDKVCKIYTR